MSKLKVESCKVKSCMTEAVFAFDFKLYNFQLILVEAKL